MSYVRKATWMRCAAAMVFSSAAAPALAQQAPLASTGSEATSTVTEIIVTAQKREQRLQDVPSSVTAISANDIQRQGIENFADFGRQVPGVVLNENQRNRGFFIIRGISTSGADVSRIKDPVSIYIDDMPVTSTYQANFVPDLRLFDVERVEVLRGPQGTLFGSGSLGGAVRIVTNRPDASGFSAATSVDFGLTNRDGLRQRYNGMVNIPLVEDKLAIRAVGYYRNEDGWVDNVGTGAKDANSTVDWGGRASLLWTPTDKLSVKLQALRQVSEPDDGDGVNPLLGKRIRSTLLPEPITARFNFYNSDIAYDLGFASLTSATTYARTSGTSTSGLLLGAPLTDDFTQRNRFIVQEFRLASPKSSKADWIVGVFFSDQRTHQVERLYAADPSSTAAQFRLTGLGDGTVATFLREITAKEYAAFGELTYPLADTLKVTGGLRWSHSEIGLSGSTANGLSAFLAATSRGGGDVSTKVNSVLTGNEARSNVLTGKASVSYEPTRNQTYYALASRGFRNGQPNTAASADPIDPVNGVNIPAQFSSDSLWNFEVGAKLRWSGGRYGLNAAAYYIPWDNIQVNGRRPSDALTFTANAGKAVSKGIEIEAFAQPVDGLQTGASLTLQDAKITDLTPAQAAITGALSGDRLPYSPKFKVSGFVQYSWAILDDADAYIRLDVQHVGSSPNGFSRTSGRPTVVNAGLATNQAYDNVNASFGISRGHYSAVAYVENLTDNDNFISIRASSAATNRYNTLRPRTFGIRIDTKY